MDFFMPRLNIHVSGTGPKHIRPIDSFKPFHQAYSHTARPNPLPIESTIRASLPGGSMRTIKSGATSDGTAIVYDRDVITTWRLPNTLASYDVFFLENAFEAALGQETMAVAIEAFLDTVQADIDSYCGPQALRDFGDFVAELGTQPVTLRISDLVEHMQGSYWKVDPHNSSWSADTLDKYVSCQDCWSRSRGRAPAVEATFVVLNWGIDDLDVEITYTTVLPKLQFENLRNVVATGDVFDLHPAVMSGANMAGDERYAEYFVWSEWLGWDYTTRSFRGKVPDEAAVVGAERMDAYTTLLEIIATITEYFPGNIRLERIIRVALPLTVKRRPMRCNKGTNLFQRPDNGHCRPDALTRPILMRSSRAGIENHSPPSMEEVSKLLERKGAASRTSSPVRLNSLTLARLHDAVMLSAPPSSLTDVEVRTVQYSPRSKNESYMPNTPTRCYSCASQGRELAITRRTDSGRCLDCEAHRVNNIAEQLQSTTLAADDDLGEGEKDPVDLWQAEIQENYRQFEQAHTGESQSDKQA